MEEPVQCTLSTAARDRFDCNLVPAVDWHQYVRPSPSASSHSGWKVPKKWKQRSVPRSDGNPKSVIWFNQNAFCQDILISPGCFASQQPQCASLPPSNVPDSKSTAIASSLHAIHRTAVTYVPNNLWESTNNDLQNSLQGLNTYQALQHRPPNLYLPLAMRSVHIFAESGSYLLQGHLLLPPIVRDTGNRNIRCSHSHHRDRSGQSLCHICVSLGSWCIRPTHPLDASWSAGMLKHFIPLSHQSSVRNHTLFVE